MTLPADPSDTDALIAALLARIEVLVASMAAKPRLSQKTLDNLSLLPSLAQALDLGVETSLKEVGVERIDIPRLGRKPIFRVFGMRFGWFDRAWLGSFSRPRIGRIS